MDIVSAFEQVGSYRAAAALCGTTHKTVRRVIEARAAGKRFDAERRPARARNTDGVRNVCPALEAVMLTAMRRQSEHRYSTADALFPTSNGSTGSTPPASTSAPNRRSAA